MIDLSSLANFTVAGVFSVLGVVAPIMISKYVKNKDAVDVLNAAIQNSLGAIQQAIETGQVRGTASPHLTVGVDYVRAHAGAAADRLGISQDMIGEKIGAQIGLRNIETNIATAASPQPTPLPLASLGPLPVASSGPVSPGPGLVTPSGFHRP